MKNCKYILFLFMLLQLAPSLVAQDEANNEGVTSFRAVASVTNNGISLIPTFSLGKPAGILEMSMGKRFTFDPQFKFSLEGQPWAVILWWRYKLINSGKFRLGIGAHPALLFNQVTATIDGAPKEILQARRFVVGELVPRYLITDKISVGMYYLYSHGMEKEGLKNTHFLTLNASFSSIRLSEKTFLHITPQVYYLKMDDNDGFYFTSTFTLARKDFPLSVSSVINQTIRSDIPAGKNFVWNITLNYTFDKKYIER